MADNRDCPPEASGRPTAPRRPFKQEHSLEERKRMSADALEAYPDRVPVIMEPSPSRSPAPAGLPKRKFLVLRDNTAAYFIARVREQNSLSPQEGLFWTVNDHALPIGNALMGDVYGKYRDEDGFLYVTCSVQNVFGLPDAREGVRLH